MGAAIFEKKDWTRAFNEDIKPFLYNDGEAEISEEVHDHFLNCMPPICHSNRVFQMSEPYDHDRENKALYMTFQQRGDQYFYLGIKTKKEASKLI